MIQLLRSIETNAVKATQRHGTQALLNPHIAMSNKNEIALGNQRMDALLDIQEWDFVEDTQNNNTYYGQFPVILPALKHTAVWSCQVQVQKAWLRGSKANILLWCNSEPGNVMHSFISSRVFQYTSPKRSFYFDTVIDRFLDTLKHYQPSIASIQRYASTANRGIAQKPLIH